MKTIHAIYENGVFRPTDPIELPDGASVEFELRSAEPPRAATLDEVYEVLSRRHWSGETDIAARHNEHQP